MANEALVKRVRKILPGVDVSKIVEALDRGAKRGGSVGYHLEEMGVLKEHEWLKALQASEVPGKKDRITIVDKNVMSKAAVWLDLKGANVDSKEGQRRKKRVVQFYADLRIYRGLILNSLMIGGAPSYVVAMGDINNTGALDHLSNTIWSFSGVSPSVSIVLASEHDILDLISEQEKRLGIVSAETFHPSDDDEEEEAETEAGMDPDLMQKTGDAPIIAHVNNIITAGVDAGASDIYLEPTGGGLAVRFRKDGLVYESERLSIPGTNKANREMAACAVARVKVISEMDIAERRRPQDGRFGFKMSDGKKISFRVASMPTSGHEDIVIRILDDTGLILSLDKLGFTEDQRALLERELALSSGIMIVTGPTGSGKTTTLYSCLRVLAQPDVSVRTIEDPIEYRLPGVRQTQVNNKAGMTFAFALRQFMRLAPDVIMVGEIRDEETAVAATQASLTGHKVLTTIHANDAALTLERLQGLGSQVDIGAASQAFRLVIAQRLLRRLCPECKKVATTKMKSAQRTILGIPLEESVHYTANGCEYCNGRGVSGRIGVFELLPISDAIRALMFRRASAAEIRAQAVEDGMVTLKQSAIKLMQEGIIPATEAVKAVVA